FGRLFAILGPPFPKHSGGPVQMGRLIAKEMKEVVGPEGRVCGVDTSPQMIAMAQGLCPGGEFALGSATDLPFEDGVFDAVTAAQLFCFVHEPDRAVEEMYRVVKPGGRVVILDTDWESLIWNCRNQDLMKRAIAMLTGPYADPSVPRTLSRRLRNAGFTVTKRRSFAVLNWEMDPETYAQQTAGFIKSMMAASNEFTEGDWVEWEADQRGTDEAGEFMFSLNRFIFSAEKEV
ncbi:methyltransferase domain-containing protein, partial [Alisedimentitalea sp. MJ-SS2]|uniref:methyltransferase domain-containing protein n=1 Tax=Aliisedimentitalea sp. MJ-SS2 TaxID=3049795 RepID=UPI0029157A26